MYQLPLREENLWKIACNNNPKKLIKKGKKQKHKTTSTNGKIKTRQKSEREKITNSSHLWKVINR